VRWSRILPGDGPQSVTSSPPLIHIKIPFPFNDVEYKWTTCKRKWNHPLPPGSLFTSVGQSLTFCGKHCLDFSFVFFQLPPCLKKPVFSKRDLLAVEGTSQAVLGSSDQRKVPAKPVTVSKKWKKSQLSPCVGKWPPEYRPFRDFRPVPLAYRPRAQISNTKSLWFRFFNKTSGTRDLRTPVAMPLQPPRTCSGPDQRCAGIRISRVYLQVISPGIYSLTRWGWENSKPRFWHFEPWFSKVLKIFENTLLYIIVGSFNSGRGRGKFLYLPLVQWERDAIRPSFFPFKWLRCFVKIRSWFEYLAGVEVVVQPPSQTNTGRSLLHPQNPVTYWQTYWINIYD